MEFLKDFSVWIGAVSLLLSGFVYLYSAVKKGRADIIRQENDDLYKSNQEMRTQKASLEATVAENRTTIKDLRDIATQTPAVTALIDTINIQQKQAAEQHTQVLLELSKLTSKIGDLAMAINNHYSKETPREKRR